MMNMEKYNELAGERGLCFFDDHGACHNCVNDVASLDGCDCDPLGELQLRTIRECCVQPSDAKRDENGMFSHPDFPAWDEGTPTDTITDWFIDNHGGCHLDCFEDSASEELQEEWYGGSGSCDCSGWVPTCDIPGAFLLSVHDTDEGPVAVFFVPN